MKSRLILAAGSVATLVSSSAFAQDGGVSATAEAPKMTVAAHVEVLPVGSAKLSTQGISDSQDTAVAYGISGSFDYALTRYLSIGVAPRLVLNIKPNQDNPGTTDTKAGEELDLRAQIRGHVPVSPGLELYASITPGYSILMSPVDGEKDPRGFAIAGAVGATYDVSPKLFVSGEVGYQRVFTTTDVTNGNQTASVDMDLSYMHVGLGAGTRF